MKMPYRFLMLFFFAFSACTQPIEPESGVIAYAVLHTPTSYGGVDGIHFEKISTAGGLPTEFQLPLETQPGWQNSKEYYKPHCPDWTPDGRYAAFNDGRNITIYDSLADKSESIALDYDLVWDVVWSPDQTKLAFAGSPEVGNSTVWLVDLVSKKTEPLVACEFCKSPTWSPDGQAIAYINSSHGNRIEVFDLNSSEIVSNIPIIEQIILPTEGPILAWSPDGKMIAYSAGNERKQYIFVMSLETEDADLIVTADIADSPVWSPTGEQLLYREGEVLKSPLPGEVPDRALTNLVITSADGKGKYAITQFDDPDYIVTCPRWLTSN